LTEPTSAFPLRLRDPRLRELVREVAARDGTTQNALIEQAIEHEVVLRGGRLAEDLMGAAQRLASLSSSQRRRLVDRSLKGFADGEARPEPLQAVAFHGSGRPIGGILPGDDPLGVVAAFEAGQHQ
jgi:hypothetical protein